MNLHQRILDINLSSRRKNSNNYKIKNQSNYFSMGDKEAGVIIDNCDDVTAQDNVAVNRPVLKVSNSRKVSAKRNKAET